MFFWYWCRWQRTTWWSCWSKYSNIWQKCQAFTLQCSHLLRQQHQRVFKNFLRHSFDSFFSKTGNLEQHLVTCSKRMKHNNPNDVFELRENLFDKLDSFEITHREEQKFLKNSAVFDFDSICVKEDSITETVITKWTGRHVPISESISSNLIQEPFVPLQYQSASSRLLFFPALENLATQTKTQIIWNFLKLRQP